MHLHEVLARSELRSRTLVACAVLLVACSVPVNAGLTPAGLPDFVRGLTPPSQLGYIDTYYQGNTDNTDQANFNGAPASANRS